METLQIKELFLRLKENIIFLLNKWVFILMFTCIGAISGFVYSKTKKVNFKAKITFILEDNKVGNSGLAGLASVAGQFGVDVSNGNGSGVLSNDNIMLYFKSPSLAKEVLISPLDTINNQTFFDRYIKTYGLKSEWEKVIPKDIFEKINSFNNISRQQDSLIQIVVDKILSDQFEVTKPDKKASLIDVVIKMEDELLAKKYCEKIVEVVSERYIKMKVQRQSNSVNKLQNRADSIMKLLNQKTFSSLSIQNKSTTMDINPLYKTNSSVDLETTIRDKSLLSSLFSSVVQNLEIAKFTLNQETPVFQIIDTPVLPLKKEKISTVITTLSFAFGFFMITIVFFIVKRNIAKILG